MLSVGRTQEHGHRTIKGKLMNNAFSLFTCGACVSCLLTESSTPPGGSDEGRDGSLAAMADADGGNDMMSQPTGVRKG